MESKIKKLAKTIYHDKLENLTPNQVKELEEHIAAEKDMKKRSPFESLKMLLQEANKLEAKHVVNDRGQWESPKSS